MLIFEKKIEIYKCAKHLILHVLSIFINYCANLKIIFPSCVGVKNILSSEKNKKTLTIEINIYGMHVYT
jgi:hypothetical protein